MAYDPFKLDVAQEDQGNTLDPFAFTDSRKEDDKKDEGPGVGTMLGSLGTEIAGSVATAAAAEKFVPSKQKLLKTGLQMLGGAASSIAAQYGVEGRTEEDFSAGRAISAGVLNVYLPGAFNLTRTKPILNEAVKGTAIASADVVIQNAVDENRAPTPQELATAGIFGFGFGGALGKLSKSINKAQGEVYGLKQSEMDELIVSDTKKGKELLSAAEDIMGRPVSQAELDGMRYNLELRKNTLLASDEKGLKGIQEDISNNKVVADLNPAKVLPDEARLARNERTKFLNAVKTNAQRLPKEINDVLDGGLQNTKTAKQVRTYLDTGKFDKDMQGQSWFGALQQYKDVRNEYLLNLKDSISGKMNRYFVDMTAAERQRVIPKINQALKDKTPFTKQYKGLYGAKERAAGKAFTLKDIETLKATTNYNRKLNPKYGKEKNLYEALKKEIYDQQKDRNTDLSKSDLMGKTVTRKDGSREYIPGVIDEHLNKYLSMASNTKNITKFLPGNTEQVFNVHQPGRLEAEWLGEVTDIGQQMRLGIDPIGQSTINFEAKTRVLKSIISQVGEDGQPSMYSPVKTNEFSDQIQLPGLSIKENLYVRPETNIALTELLNDTRMESAITSPFMKGAYNLYQNLNVYTKSTKVLMNPPTYFVNAYGGAFSAFGLGILPSPTSFRNYGKMFKLSVRESKFFDNMFTKGQKAIDRKKFLQYHNEMTKYGITNGNIAVEDIKAVMESANIFKALDSPFQFLGKMYSASDNATRAVIYESQIETLVKLFPDIAGGSTVKSIRAGKRPPEAILRAASEITKDVYQDYDRVSRKIKFLSRHGVMPQFVTFTAEFTRNLYNQAKIATQMINGTFGEAYGLARVTDQAILSEMRAEGFKRLGYLLGVTGIGGGAAIFGVNRTGLLDKFNITKTDPIDQEQEDALRRVMPSYAKNKSLLFAYDSESKLGSYANASYIIPHAIPTNMLTAMMSGADEKEIIGLLREEFLGEGTFLQRSLINALQNRTIRGKKITYAVNDEQAAYDLITYVLEDAFQPGISRELKRAFEAAEGKGDFTPKEVFARQLGLRFNKFDMNEMVRFRFQDLMDSESGYKGKYSVARDYGELNEEDLEREYQQANEGAKIAYDKMTELYNDMTTHFGFSESEATELMLDSGSKLSKKNAFRIINGLPYKEFDRQKPLTNFEKFDAFAVGRDDKQIRQGIRDMQKENALEAQKLGAEYKRRIKAERRNIPPYYQTFLSLDVQERANFIAELGLDKNISELRKLQRYGIYNQNVEYALRLMQ